MLNQCVWSEVTEAFCHFTDVVGADEIGELNQIYPCLNLCVVFSLSEVGRSLSGSNNLLQIDFLFGWHENRD